jgi:8-oxo-dGTP pyrophosphatase MutT (NUDIX family)
MIDRLRLLAGTGGDIIGRDQYLESAVLVPFVETPEGPCLLFEKRSALVRQPGEICFPGGVFDPELDEKHSDTALRETVEELGVRPEQVKIACRLGTLVGRMGILVEAFAGVLDIEDVEMLSWQRDEVEVVFTLPFRYFLDQPPEIFRVRQQVVPYEDRPDGTRETTFPADKLGLPERYRKPWGGAVGRIFAWETPHGTLWGITAELVSETVRRWKRTEV